MNGKVHRPAARSIAKRLFVSGFRFCGSSEKQDRRYAVDCTSSKRGLRWMSIGVEDGEIKQKETKVTKCFRVQGSVSESSERSSFSLLPFVKTLQCNPLYQKADRLSHDVIGAAIEVHRHMGSGLIESIYERCMLRELEPRSIPSITQQLVRIEYKGLVFDEPLRFDIIVESCLLLELKAVEVLHPFSKAQLFSYMKLLDIPIGLLINFHEPVLKNGISRMILPGANRTEGNEDNEISF